MTISANVAYSKDVFVAELSNGQLIERSDLQDMALALSQAGVKAKSLNFDWRVGAGMVTAGKQVALKAELRLLENSIAELPAAA